jgi:hypothetical protein
MGKNSLFIGKKYQISLCPPCLCGDYHLMMSLRSAIYFHLFLKIRCKSLNDCFCVLILFHSTFDVGRSMFDVRLFQIFHNPRPKTNSAHIGLPLLLIIMIFDRDPVRGDKTERRSSCTLSPLRAGLHGV